MTNIASCRKKLARGVIGCVAGIVGLATPATSCYLEATADISGAFSVGHRGSIPVAIATHDAIKEGHIAALPKENAARLGQLYIVRLRAMAHMQKLAIRGQTVGSPVSVLLTQSGAWMRFNDPEVGAVYHAEPPAEGQVELLIPDVVYAALLDGKVSVQGAAELGLLRVYGAEDEHAVISTFSDAIDLSRQQALEILYPGAIQQTSR